MSNLNGNDLMNKFQSLGIDTGNLTVDLFNSWFDTDDQDMIDFLTWLCTNLGPENVISATELEEYNELVNNGEALEGSEYEEAVEKLEEDFPGLLDVEMNEIEVECLEEEKEVLLAENAGQEELLKQFQELNQNLESKIITESDREMKLLAEQEIQKESCMELAQKLEETNKKLHTQLVKYSEQLNNFERGTSPTFICNQPLDEFNHYHKNITFYMRTMLNKERQLLVDPALLVNEMKMFEDSFPEGLSDLESLEARLLKSMFDSSYKEIKEKQMEAEIEYMKNVNINNLLSVNLKTSQSQLEVSLNMKREIVNQMFSDLDAAIKKAARNHIDKLILRPATSKLEKSREKLTYLQKLDENITKVLSHHTLVYLLFLKEKDNFKLTHKLFKDVNDYISYNLDASRARIEPMMTIIFDYETYLQAPIEEKCKLIQKIGNLVIKDSANHHAPNQANHSLSDVLEALNDVRMEYKAVNNKIINRDSKNLRENCQNIVKQIDLLKHFLCGGPSTQMIVLPYNLQMAFEEVATEIQSFRNAVQSAVAILLYTEDKLQEDKWLKLYRQLWVHFLTNPDRIPKIIEQIESEARKQWKCSLE